MWYRIITNTMDALYGLKRIEINDFSVTMPADISNHEFQLLVAEVWNIPDEKREGLMTCEALSAYIGGTSRLIDEMKKMPIGGKLRYDSVLITRLSDSLYNGRYMYMCYARY